MNFSRGRALIVRLTAPGLIDDDTEKINILEIIDEQPFNRNFNSLTKNKVEFLALMIPGFEGRQIRVNEAGLGGLRARLILSSYRK